MVRGAASKNKSVLVSGVEAQDSREILAAQLCSEVISDQLERARGRTVARGDRSAPAIPVKARIHDLGRRATAGVGSRHATRFGSGLA